MSQKLYGALAQAAAQKYGINPSVFMRQIEAESSWNPNAKSPAGAIGLTQLMPGTAAGLKVKNPWDPAQNIEGGAKYFRQQLDKYNGDYRLALAAYNAGPGAVAKYGGVPPYRETQNYVQKILGGATDIAGGATQVSKQKMPTFPGYAEQALSQPQDTGIPASNPDILTQLAQQLMQSNDDILKNPIKSKLQNYSLMDRLFSSLPSITGGG